MTLIAPIVTARLTLVSLGIDFIESALAGDRKQAETIGGFAIPDGWPQNDAHGKQFLRYRLGDLQHDPAAQPWLGRAIVLSAAGTMIGHVGFHSPPDDRGAAEIGYTVFAPHRRSGYAEEAVRAMFAWARQQDVHRFIASIAPDNAPSLALAAKLGFVRTGEQMDEIDGIEYVFELDLAQ